MDDAEEIKRFIRTWREYKKSHSEHDATFDAMKSESDRGCVLLGASLLEWQAGELLRDFFMSRNEFKSPLLLKQIDNALDPTAVNSLAGAAAARFRLCFVLGLISEWAYECVRAIATFRNNHFAHSIEAASFEDAKVRTSLLRMCTTVFGAIGVEEPTFLDAMQEDPKYLFMVAVNRLYHDMRPDFIELRDAESRRINASSAVTNVKTATPPSNVQDANSTGSAGHHDG